MDMTTIKSCSVDGCGLPFYGKGMCSKHYARNRRENNERRCSVDGCEKAYVSSGYCSAHYRRLRKKGSVGTAEVQLRKSGRKCEITGCGRDHRTGGLCEAHAARKKRGADLDPPVKAYLLHSSCQRGSCEKPPIANGYCSSHESRRNKLFNVYGLTYEEFDQLFDMQNGVCFLCEVALDRDARETNVDHCHETGRTRGILCNKCNVGLGMFHDDPEVLRAAILYLESTEDIRDRL